MCLNQPGAGIHSWAGANICHRLPSGGFTFEVGTGDVNAVSWFNKLDRRHNIRRWIADCAPKMRAVDNLAGDAKWITKKLARRAHRSIADRGPNGAAADHITTVCQ